MWSKMQFTAIGHTHVLSTHRNTIEFTHDKNLTHRGDCILGVNATYTLDTIKKEQFSDKIKIMLTIDDISDEIVAEYNPSFSDPHEMVIRKTDFTDKRTFAIHATKAAKDIKRALVEKMKKPDAILVICVEQIKRETKETR